MPRKTSQYPCMRYDGRNCFGPVECKAAGKCQRIPGNACEHGRARECDDCNEQAGADMAEASVGK